MISALSTQNKLASDQVFIVDNSSASSRGGGMLCLENHNMPTAMSAFWGGIVYLNN